MKRKGLALSRLPKTLSARPSRLDIYYAQELIDGLDIRNILSHDYSGDKFGLSEKQLRADIFPAIEKLYHFLAEEALNQM